jgi:hypothetical protein
MHPPLKRHRSIRDRQNRQGRSISHISKIIIPRWIGREKQDIRVIAGADIGMKGCKRTDIFIEYDIPRDIYTTRRNIKALKTLVHIAIAKKNTAGWAKLQFMSIIWPQIWPTSATEDAKAGVVWSGS